MEKNPKEQDGRRQPQVERRLQITSDTISKVLDRINQLDDMLQGVLSPSMPEGVVEKGNTDELVPLAQEIKIIGEMAETALGAIESISDRLEL